MAFAFRETKSPFDRRSPRAGRVLRALRALPLEERRRRAGQLLSICDVDPALNSQLAGACVVACRPDADRRL